MVVSWVDLDHCWHASSSVEVKAYHEAGLASDAVKACHGKLVYGLNAKVHREVCQRLQHPGVYVALVDAPLHKQCSWVSQHLTVALQGGHSRQLIMDATSGASVQDMRSHHL